MIKNILIKARQGQDLSKEDALKLLNVKNGSEDFYELLSAANQLTREEFDNKGYVFAQIGINVEPCSVDCKFCSMGKSHFAMNETKKKSINEILEETNILIQDGVDDLFLMTTADYPVEDYLKIAREVRNKIPDDVRLIANIGDFDKDTAFELKEAGFTGAYHINRLREGIDTTVKPETRIKTLDAIKEAGLEFYYCVEPIGPEHDYEEMVEEIIRARDYDVDVMAVMRRTPVKGTPLFDKGQITALELTKIAAVTRIVSKPQRAMNVHEVIPMTLLAGVNLLCAEAGANPRDTVSDTETGRGCNVHLIRELLIEAEYDV